MDAQRRNFLLRTLGSAKAFCGSRLSNLEPRQVAILSYLAYARPDKTSRDHLISVFWPHVAFAKARHSVSQAIHTIRTAEPQLDLATERDLLTLGSNVQWDVGIVRSGIASGNLANIIPRLEGPFLSDVTILGSNVFEDWRSEVIAQLVTEIEEAIPKWVEQCVFRDDWRSPRKLLQALQIGFGLEAADLRVPLHIKEYLEGRTTVHKLANPAATIEQSVPLIGRTEQIAALWEAWSIAKSGRMALAAVLAEAGLGKTRLSSAFVRAISSEACVIRISCYENTRNQGLGALRQALTDDPKVAQRLSVVAEPWRGIVAAVLKGDRSVTRHSSERQEFVFESIARFFQSISLEEPLVVLIDDAQWADTATIDSLTYLMRGERAVPLMLVLAARTDARAGLPSCIRRLLSAAQSRSIHLGRLTLSEIRQFTSTVCTSPAAADSIAAEMSKVTSGHTFLVSELIRTVGMCHANDWTVENVRTAAESSIMNHADNTLAPISLAARRLLSVLAVVGKPTLFEVLRKSSGLPPRRFLKAYDELLSIGLILDTEGALSCCHDLIREIVYRRLTTTQRRILHARAAAAIARSRHRPEDLVTHYRGARMRHRLYIAALQAAGSNYKSSSPNETDHFLRMAAGATKSPRKRSALLWKRANYAHNFGRLNRAIPLYRMLLEEDVLPMPKKRYIEARLLDAHSLIGDLTPRVINEWGIALANQTFSSETIDTHIECLRSLVRYNFLRSDFAAVAAAVEKMSAVADTYPGTPSAARALAWRAIILLAEGDGPGANDLAEEAMKRASAVEDPRLTCDVLTVKIMAKAYVGELHEALDACRQGVQLAERFRLFRFRNMCLANMSAIAMDVGLNDVAESSLLEVLRAAESNEVPADIAQGYFNLAVLRLTQRKFSEVNSLAEKCLDAAQRAGNNFIVLSVHALLGLTALERGALQEARTREKLILKESRPYIGDDIVPIEHFLARMSEITNSTERGIQRLETILTNPPPFVNACCILELQLELARLLGRTNKKRASEIALSVASAASVYGAGAISEVADRMVHRFGSSSS